MRRLLLGAATLEPGRGGIARVARAMAEAAAGEGTAMALTSFLDRGPLRVAGRDARCAGGSKGRFFLLNQGAALGASHQLYDSAAMAQARLRWPGRRPFALYIHGVEVWEGARRDALEAVFAADLVLANSRYTLRRFQALHGPLPRARVCPLGTAEDAPAAPRPRGGTAPPTALVLSRLDLGDGYKGHRELIAAWPAVRAAVPGARLWVAGGGSGLAALRAQAAGAPGVEVLGFVPEAQLPALWAEADVFAMPSRGEGFGLVYVEAMRQGLPVIASVHDAGAEVNRDGVSGFNVDLDRPGELADRLAALLGSPELRRSMGAAAAERWAAHYRAACFRARFRPMLLDLLSL